MNAMTLLLKRIFLFCSPFLLLTSIYIISDPYKIIYSYDNYNDEAIIFKNRDFVSTEMYLKNSKRFIYDSFIFGGSTAACVPPSIWEKYINTSNYIFSFDASVENIVGIWSKIKYIHKTAHPIKNALLVFDTDYSFKKFINNDPIYMKHYKIYPSSRFDFQYRFFLNFLNLKFLLTYLHYKVINRFYPYMTNVFINSYTSYDVVTNEMYAYGRINEMKEDSLKYYEKRKNLFELRSSKHLEINSQINEDQLRMLKEIKDIFVKDSTDFRILITPLFNQIAFNKKDLSILETMFGEKNVFDFSGNNEFTEKISNYYDVFHFKPYVGAEILNIVYKSSNK